MDIKDVIRRRSDLSTFLVHLTRDGIGPTDRAKDRLKSMLSTNIIEARNMFGQAKVALETAQINSASQHCVCFTETPIEHVNLMLPQIANRAYSFAPYGIGITKRTGRGLGVNPVWYLDITPGHHWLTNNVNNLIDQAIQTHNFDQSDIAALTPFMEQMGTGPFYRKEFWWEREWRKVGNFIIPNNCIAFCPEIEIAEFKTHVHTGPYANIKFIDPNWSLEETIAYLANTP